MNIIDTPDLERVMQSLEQYVPDLPEDVQVLVRAALQARKHQRMQDTVVDVEYGLATSADPAKGYQAVPPIPALEKAIITALLEDAKNLTKSLQQKLDAQSRKLEQARHRNKISRA